MMRDYNIAHNDAVTALEQCGDVEEALVWLATSDRELTRKKKKKPEEMVE